MYSLLSRVPLSALVGRELPAAGVSLVLAELFYKFHSFTLECGAFLLTWYGVSWLLDAIMRAGGNE
jgi:hypothetical protein